MKIDPELVAEPTPLTGSAWVRAQANDIVFIFKGRRFCLTHEDRYTEITPQMNDDWFELSDETVEILRPEK